jgi:predicted N-acetyltransferase YhbS
MCGMSNVSLEAFTPAHIEGAARVLEARHAAHRLRQPLLPEVSDFERQVALELEDASGSVATVDGDVVGYLIGKHKEDAIGPHIWSGLAGHAVEDPEIVRDLYADAAARWVADGLTRHFVFAPAHDELIEPWARLSFGISAAQAIRTTGSEGEGTVTPGVTVRRSSPADLPDVARLAAVLEAALLASPSFSGVPGQTEEQHAEEWSDTWSDERYVHFVAERDGVVVGHVLLYHRPTGDLRVPENNIDLGNAATFPDVCGSGVGLALTSHVLAWAHEHGYETMTTDWRMSNLAASRFWPRRGFREAFVRLYRSIP